MKNKNPFTKHPESVSMTYLQHLVFALGLARRTFTAALASLCHAFFPFMFTTYTSRTIARLHEILYTRFQKPNDHA